MTWSWWLDEGEIPLGDPRVLGEEGLIGDILWGRWGGGWLLDRIGGGCAPAISLVRQPSKGLFLAGDRKRGAKGAPPNFWNKVNY